MPQMPAPMMTELTASRRRDKSRRLEIASANSEVSIPMKRDARLMSRLYRSGMATEKASMPMKCIDQMPMPIEAAPPSNQSSPARRSAPATRSVSRSAVYETRIATMTERCTSHGLYVACIHWNLPQMAAGVQCAQSQLPADNCDAVDSRSAGFGEHPGELRFLGPGCGIELGAQAREAFGIVALQVIDEPFTDAAAQIPRFARVGRAHQSAQLHRALARIHDLQRCEPAVPFRRLLADPLQLRPQGRERHPEVDPEQHRSQQLGAGARPVLERVLDDPLQRHDHAPAVP